MNDTLIKVTPVGNFCKSDNPDEVMAFFDDTFGVKFGILRGQPYGEACADWTFTCVDDALLADLLLAKDAEYDLGGTTVKIQKVASQAANGAHELRLSIHPVPICFPAQEVLQDLMDHFADSLGVTVEDRGGNIAGSSVWAVWALVAAEELPGLLGSVTCGDFTVLVSLPPKCILIKLVNAFTGAPLTGEVLSGAETAFINVFRRTYKATVTIADACTFRCETAQDLGGVVLGVPGGEPTPSKVLVKGVSYVCTPVAGCEASTSAPPPARATIATASSPLLATHPSLLGAVFSTDTATKHLEPTAEVPAAWLSDNLAPKVILAAALATPLASEDVTPLADRTNFDDVSIPPSAGLLPSLDVNLLADPSAPVREVLLSADSGSHASTDAIVAPFSYVHRAEGVPPAPESLHPLVAPAGLIAGCSMDAPTLECMGEVPSAPSPCPEVSPTRSVTDLPDLAVEPSVWPPAPPGVEEMSICDDELAPDASRDLPDVPPDAALLPGQTIQAENYSKQSVLAKLERMPGCAERTLLRAFYFFKYECADQHAPAPDIAKATRIIGRLRGELDDEGIASISMANVLDILEVNLPLWTAEVCARHLWQALKEEFQQIDIEFLVELLKRNRTAARTIEGKDVILLLGNTGAGKSTTIHFLGGSTMCMIDDEETGQDHLQIVSSLPQLRSFITSAHCSSETLNINAIDLEAGDVRFTLCDTPGFGDNRGDEIDIANGLGIADAVRGCRSVRPLFLISFPQVGDRFDGVVDLLRIPIAMMDPIQGQLESFSYWFTKFEPRYNKKIYKIVNEKLRSLSGSCTDETLLVVMRNMLDKIGQRQKVAVVLDPISDSREDLLQELLSTPAIANPGAVFRNFATGENLNKLNLQLGKHLSRIDSALSRNMFRVVTYKLAQLKVIQECLQLEDCRVAYVDSVKKVRAVAEAVLAALYDRMQPCAVIRDKSIEGILRKSAVDTCSLFELDEVRAEHFPDIPHFPSSCITLVTSVQRELANALQKTKAAADSDTLALIENMTLTDLETIAAQLDSMDLIFATFAEVFCRRKLEVARDENVATMLGALSDINRDSQMALQGIFAVMTESGAACLAAQNIPMCVQCMDILKRFVALFPHRLNQPGDPRGCTAAYVDLQAALGNTFKAQHVGSLQLLGAKSLCALTADEIAALQVAVKILAAGCDPAVAAHFGVGECGDGLEACFEQVKVALLKAFADTETELRNLYRSTPAGAFSAIRERVQVLVHLREDPTLSSYTMQAFNDVAESVKALVAELFGEVSAQLTLLESSNWHVNAELFRTKLLQLHDAEVLAYLAEHIYKDEFKYAENRFQQLLGDLGERINATSFSAVAPDALSAFADPMAFTASLHALYSDSAALLSGPVLMTEADSSSPAREPAPVLELLTVVRSLFETKLRALVPALEDYFPCTGDLSDYRADLELLWAATRTAELVESFAMADTSELSQRVKSFASMHHAALGAALEDNFVALTDESIIPDETAAQQKNAAAFRLLGGLDYVRRTVRLRVKQLRSVEGTTEPGGALSRVVFAGEVADLFAAWLGVGPSGMGRVGQHLAGYRADCDKEMGYEVLNTKWLVARAMGVLDPIVRPKGGASNDWAGYADVASHLRDSIRKINDTVSLDIKAENFAKVSEFFSRRDLNDPTQVQALSTALKELTDKVASILFAAKQKAGKLVLSLSTAISAFPLLEDISRLKGACSAVRDFLLEPLKATFAQDIAELENRIAAATKTFAATADKAIDAGDFGHAEQILQSVQRILEAAYGSFSQYTDAMTAAGVPVSDRIDQQARRTKVAEFVASVRAVFDTVFQDVLTEFSTTGMPANRAPKNKKKPTQNVVKDAEDDYSQVGAYYSLKRPASSSTQAPNMPANARKSSIEHLKRTLTQYSPKTLSEELARAATFGQAEFYKHEEDAFFSFLKAKLLSLTACCQQPQLPRDQKEALVVVLQESFAFLPPKLLAEVSGAVNDCAAAIKAEKESAERQMEEAKQTNDINVLLDFSRKCYQHYQYTDCNSSKLKVSTAIRKAVLRFEEDLRTGKVGSVIKNLPKAWLEWMRYFKFCQKLNDDPYFCFRFSDRHRTVADEEMFLIVENFVRSFGAAIKKQFAEIHSLPDDEPRLFSLLSAQLDIVDDFMNTVSHAPPPRPVSLECRMCDTWSPDEVDAFFSKVVAVFKHYNVRIETVAMAADLDPAVLKNLLENYSQSDNLHMKTEAFCATPVARIVPPLAAFKSQCCAFKELKDGVLAEVFTRMAATVKPALLHNTSLDTPNSIDRDQFYIALYQAYSNLSRAAILQPYANSAVVTFVTVETECNEHLVKELHKIGAFLTDTILGSADVLKEADHEKFSIWFDNLRAARQAFDNSSLAQVAATLAHDVHKKFIAVVTNMVRKAAKEKDNEKFLEEVFAIKQIAVSIALMRKDVDKLIDGLLHQVRTECGPQRIMNLGVLLNSAQNPMAQMIVQDQKAFEGNQLLLFNTKVARFSEDDVLDKGPGGIRGVSVEHSVLKDQFLLFTKEYQALVSLGLPKHKEAAKQCVFDARKIAADQTMSEIDRVRGLMVQLFVSWTLSNAEHYFDAVDNSAHPEGELSAAEQEDQRKYLKQPHAGQVISIFRMFGIDDGGKLQNHFVQISTGEGKSVILAITSCIFALLGYTVNCACYSEYLSNRDHAGFKQLFNDFGVYDFVVYDTFHQLCERYLNSFGDIREGMESIMQTQAGHDWNRGSAQPSRFAARKKVLLIDEVDVFFNKDFYGSAYRPLAKLVDPTVSALIDTVWATRGTKSRVAAMKATPEFAACVAKFPTWEFLIEESVKSMLHDLATFESHEVKIVGDRIGYKDQDKVSFDIMYGYKTLFAYYKANAEGKISATSLQNKKCITVDCGSYSFAEIPKLYELVLGVSGTLETLSAPEQKVLSDVYMIRRFTYTPSVYGQNALDFHPDNGRDIKIDTDNAHFAAITTEIADRRSVPSDPTLHRPVLVFFETTAMLMRYYNSTAASAFKAKLKFVTEEVSESDKENAIRLATSPDTITLLSREFGRGTDFIIFDDRISKCGGVHVIQTFLSEELSEETQIKGRAARQGCKGSFSMILSELSLEKFGIRSSGPDGVAEMKSRSAFDAVLKAKRDAFFEDKYQDTIRFVHEIEEDHKLAMVFLKDLASVPCRMQEAAGTVSAKTMADMLAFLADRNKSRAVEAPGTLSRTIVLMDATGSMSSVLTKAKNTVKTMFMEALSVLANAKGVGAAAFEVQFAVYRNYNAPEESLLQASGWESDPHNLFQFMDTISAGYGLGNEAVEVGLWHANNEVCEKKADHSYQVILIGDVPPNTNQEVAGHRESQKGESYWSRTRFSKPCYYETELQRLVAQDVPVHAFYVHPHAASAFQSIARVGKGECKELDVNTSAGAETLAGLITERILNDVGGGGALGLALVEDYRRMFPKGYMK